MDEFENDIPASKSQRKREAHAAQALGEKLVSLRTDQLKQLPVGDDLFQAISLAQSLHNKHGALKRQLQYIGKLMRGMETAELEQELEKILKPHTSDIKRFHLVENWRDRLVTDGDVALNEFLKTYFDVDRQTLRQLVRNSQASDNNQATRARRKLFKFLNEIIPEDV